MYRYLLISVFLLSPFLKLEAADDAINQFTYGYLKKINEYIEESDF